MEERNLKLAENLLVNADTLIKWCFALNGAASTALLALVSSTIEKKDSFANWESFGTSLTWLLIGLVFAVLSNLAKLMCVNFFSQCKEPNRNDMEEIRISLLVGDRAVLWGLTSLGLFTASILAFSAGVFCAKNAVFG